MKKFLSVTVLLLGVVSAVSGQQNVQFNQFAFNQFYFNPAYAGHQERLNIQAIYRNQWAQVNNAPKSMAFSLDGNSLQQGVGYGINVEVEHLGAIKKFSTYASLAYRIQGAWHNNSSVSFGLGFGLEQSYVDLNLLQVIDADDEYLSSLSSNRTYPDARAGIFVSNDNWFLGFSAQNLVGRYMFAKAASYFIPRAHYYLSGGVQIPIKQDEVDLKPLFLIKDDASGPTTVDMNVLFFLKKQVWLGMGYRSTIKLHSKKNTVTSQFPNSAIGLLQFDVKEKYKVGYAYEYGLGKAGSYNGSTHEISIGFYFGQRERPDKLSHAF